MNDSGKIILALLGGVVAGATLGLLLAPRKGSETIEMVGDQAKRFSENIKSKVDEGVQAVNEWKDKVIEKTNLG